MTAPTTSPATSLASLKRSALVLVPALALLGACQPALRPVAQPSPATSLSSTGSSADDQSESSTESASRADASIDLEEMRDSSTADDNVALESVMNAEPSYDLNVLSYESHERVSHYVRQFSGPARDRMSKRLQLGTRYDPMIRAKLRAAGMPEDLTYLALIESGYDKHAYSRAAAVGMWQFMTATARGVGLRVDWWVDERRDPARATDGAIRFLSSLQKQFGSIYLAAAAYNGGPGRVSRGLTRFAEEMGDVEGDDRFFALAEQQYLKAETKNYVPQLIAATLVSKSPDKYGFSYDTLPEYKYDSVHVGPGTSLAAVVDASGVTSEEISDLNPALLRGVVPPNDSVWVRVPVGTADATWRALDSMPDSLRIGYRTVRTTGKESVASLAKSAGISSRNIAAFNPGLRTAKSGRLVAKQMVRIPHNSTVAMMLDVPDPSIERYASSARTHVVKRGETLSHLAVRYDTTVARIKAANGMKNDRIRIGQKVRIPAR